MCIGYYCCFVTLWSHKSSCVCRRNLVSSALVSSCDHQHVHFMATVQSNVAQLFNEICSQKNKLTCNNVRSQTTLHRCLQSQWAWCHTKCLQMVITAMVRRRNIGIGQDHASPLKSDSLRRVKLMFCRTLSICPGVHQRLP